MEIDPNLGLTQLQCYKNAYPTQAHGSKRATLEVNASAKAANNKIITRLSQLRSKVEDRLSYSALQSFNKLNEIQDLALTGEKKELNAALKAEHLKGELALLYIKQTKELNPAQTNIIVSSEEDKEALDNVKPR